ncbi:hypothetical protein SV7mr_40860 [Stieleria bergensis]|uniref:Uncharacterized protein n=1 Tax=Stieleria bergensis TaxID=2528025 RepID=A0A517SZH2_9BACT|nr:hypothetical protein SV7mr_40860 [Planctomycetes bacterium SV_7m_r]
MKSIFPAATGFWVVAMIAIVGFANASFAQEATTANSVATESTDAASSDAVSSKDQSTQDQSTQDQSTQDQSTQDQSTQEQPTQEQPTQEQPTVGASQDDQASGELSVAPLDHVTYPPDRPGWASQKTPYLKGSNHSWVVVTQPWDTEEQCNEELPVLVRAAVELYAQNLTGRECNPETITQQWIDKELVSRTHVGTLSIGDQEMHEIAVQLHFDDQARAFLQQACREELLDERMRVTGLGIAASFAGLVLLTSVLNMAAKRYS